jgi:hypothetical protein
MISKAVSDYPWCRYPATCNVHGMAGIPGYKGESGTCTPIIDAEKSNESLQIVAQIRKRKPPVLT